MVVKNKVNTSFYNQKISFLKYQFYFIILFFSFPVFSEDFRIIYSSSLNGNLYSCQCGLKFSVGLAKRATFFRQIGINPTSDILVDTGNSLEVNSSINKSKAIYESFKKIGYHSIGIGMNDLQEENLSVLKDNQSFVCSGNVFEKRFFGSRRFGNSVKYINRGKKVIGIVSLTSPSIFYGLSKEVKSNIFFNELELTAQSIFSSEKKLVDIWIILLNGDIKEALRLAAINTKVIVIYGNINSTQLNSVKQNEKEANSRQIFSTNDKLGDKIGILNVTNSESGISIKSFKVLEMDVDKLADSEDILAIMNFYNIKPN